jgi:hypothetical protein
MNITELDEFQGLTADMMPKWLVANGWQRMPAQDMPRSECWVRKGGAGGTIWIGVESSAEKTLSKLAVWMECSVQALLREINPRMRKGMPSEAARKACASWLVRDVETGEVELHRTEGAALYSASDYAFRTLRIDAVPLRDFGDFMEFWPCDANGNKVRWPTDAEGKML